MHEYSIVQAMFDQIERTARVHSAREVRCVRIRVGAAAGVDAELLRTAYDTFRAGTLCAEASLEIDDVAVRWTCPAGHGEVPAGAPLVCVTCGRPAKLAAGDEIILDRLELVVDSGEPEDPSCELPASDQEARSLKRGARS